MSLKFENYLLLNLLNSIEGVGLRILLLLMDEFNSAYEIVNAGISRLYSINGLPKTTAKKISKFDFLDIDLTAHYTKLFEKCTKENVEIITYYCPEYPQILRNIYSPPFVLYKKGNGEFIPENALSIVGTRNNSTYGKLATENITTDLVNNGVQIISGMARGIDTIAHQTALNNNASTIAVVGSGIDVIYPAENKKLYKDIQENGFILTEFDPGTSPDAKNFPRRNRIISALSMGTIVIETGLKGGAMQTAHLALDQGKEVFAVPGNITSPNSEGTNTLIQNGLAKLVRNGKDILEEFHFKKIETKEIIIPELTVFEEKIFSILTDEPKHIDIISKECKLPINECLSNLFLLEVKGVVNQTAGKKFSKY